MALALQRAPRVYAWVDLVEDPSGLEPLDTDWSAGDALPDTLIALGRTYVLVMLANARALAPGQTSVQTRIDGLDWIQQAFPYQGKCVRWWRQEREAMQVEQRRMVDRILGQAGCLALFTDTIGG